MTRQHQQSAKAHRRQDVAKFLKDAIKAAIDHYGSENAWPRIADTYVRLVDNADDRSFRRAGQAMTLTPEQLRDWKRKR